MICVALAIYLQANQPGTSAAKNAQTSKASIQRETNVPCKTPPLMLMTDRAFSIQKGYISSIARFHTKECSTDAAHQECATNQPTMSGSVIHSQHHNPCLPHLHPNTCSCQRRDRVEQPQHVVGSHLAVLQAADLAALAQPLQTKREFPALRLVDEEHVFLAVRVAHRST